MTDPVTQLTNSTAYNPNGPAAPSKEMGKEEFMRLLITQLSAQDPLNPMDSKEFVVQLSQFASLEQLTNLGSKMDDLVAISGASNAANAVTLLGKEVRTLGNSVKGEDTVYYDLSNNAKSVRIEVRNPDGSVAKVFEGLPTDKGLHEFKLEGLEPGDYTFRVEALDDRGKEIPSQLSVLNKIKAVSFTGPTPVLVTESGLEIPASELIEIREPLANQGGGG